MSAVLSALCLFVVACSSVGSAPPTTLPAAGQLGSSVPTPSGPTPTLPLARPVVSPSASPSAVAGQPNGGPFVLTSSAFTDGAALPTDFTCDGAGQSPPMAWTGAPPGSAAFALIAQDMDAHSADSTEPLTVWLVYNMPPQVTQLAAGQPARALLTNGAQQGTNGQQTIGYARPCPNHGDPTHHLTFQVFAQDGYVTLQTGAVIESVRDALNGHTVGQAQLTATVQR